MAKGYKTNAELPARVRKELDTEAQDVYRVAYNNALASGKDPRDAAGQAWEAVGRGWKEQNGHWIKAGEIA